MINKKGLATPSQIIAGILLVIAGLLTIIGRANLGAVLGGLALLIEAIEILAKSGV